MVLSRWPLVAWESLHHRLVSPPLVPLATAQPHGSKSELQWDRPLLRVTVRLPGDRPLHLINLHLRAPLAAPVPGQRQDGVWNSVAGWAEGFYLASMKRAGQALEARLAVIDAAQKNIGSLSEQVTSLTSILSNKQARGAFGQGQLASSSALQNEKVTLR